MKKETKKTEGQANLRIIGFKMIPASHLDPHPEAEAFPRGSEDQNTLNESVLDVGVVTPLHVIANPDHHGRWLVIDGVTRLNTFEDGPTEEIPCLTCECDDVTAFVLTVNCDRRKVSTGTRILSYLLRHRDIVLAADDLYGDGRFNCTEDGTGKPNKRTVGHVTNRYTEQELGRFCRMAISSRLSVSDKDVGAAVELLRCHERNRIPEIKQGGVTYKERDADPKDDADKSRTDTVKCCLRGVLGGVTPIRRWRASFAGRVTTEGGKDDADYAAIGFRSITSLTSVFTNWEKIDPSTRGDLIRKFQLLQEKYDGVINGQL